MDYIKDLPEARLIKVIEGEQGGISKSVKWKGGGSFIYAEIMEWQEQFVSQIEKAKKFEDLERIWNEMKTKRLSFLSGCLEVPKFEENFEEFKDLDFKEQQRTLIEALNLNFLYVPLSEIDDAEFKVSGTDKKMNTQFYKK